MPFEINLQRRIVVYVLRCAGLETDAFHDRWMEAIVGKGAVPFEVELPCFVGNAPTTAGVTLLEDGKVVPLRIGASDATVERKLRKFIERYSAENDGVAILDRERDELWAHIRATLKRHGMSHDKISAGEQLLNRAAIESLMKLSQEVERPLVSNISDLLANGHVVRADQEFAVRWLMELFAQNPDPFERAQLSLRIWENTVAAIGDELIEMIENRKYGSSRSGLLMALAKAKHPKAADVIASVLYEEHMAWAGLQALAKLKATQHVDAVRRCLHDPDSDVRREAKKTLKKLGFPVEIPPPPIHLIKGRAKVPKGLTEWSQNLDMDDLEPALKNLASCIERGFGADEIREVIGVVEEMRVEQTKAFCFSISANQKSGALWILIFMDDINSPDMAVHASAAVIEKFEPLVPLK